MGLQALSISAVAKLKAALGDLAIDLILRKRVDNAYVPGASISTTDSDSAAKGVITKYRHDEIDGTMVQHIDVVIVLFPPDNGAIPETNDLIVHGTRRFRVVRNDPMYIGSEIAFNVIQGRPPV